MAWTLHHKHLSFIQLLKTYLRNWAIWHTVGKYTHRLFVKSDWGGYIQMPKYVEHQTIKHREYLSPKSLSVPQSYFGRCEVSSVILPRAKQIMTVQKNCDQVYNLDRPPPMARHQQRPQAMVASVLVRDSRAPEDSSGRGRDGSFLVVFDNS